MKRMHTGMVLLAVIAALACWAVATPAFADRGNTGGAGEIRVEGRITAVSAVSVTIGTTVVPVSAATRIERNGVRVALTALRIGDRGQARIPVGAAVASRVEAVGP